MNKTLDKILTITRGKRYRSMTDAAKDCGLTTATFKSFVGRMAKKGEARIRFTREGVTIT